jgi:hypothetical protein
LIKTQSNNQKIAYVGMSQGGLLCVVNLNLYEKIRDFFSILILISPALFLKKPKNIATRFLMNLPPSIFGTREFLGIVQLTQRIFSSRIAGRIAYRIMAGIDMANIKLIKPFEEFALIPEYATSTQHVVHWFQLLHNNGKIRKFNKDAYQRDGFHNENEEYNLDLSEMKFPYFAYFGKNDPVVDVDKSVDFIGKDNCFVHEDVHHVDFNWSEKICEEMNPKIVERINNV